MKLTTKTKYIFSLSLINNHTFTQMGIFYHMISLSTLLQYWVFSGKYAHLL